MKTAIAVLAAALLSATAFAQGTINFNNRNLAGPGGTIYHAAVTGIPAEFAQLYLITGGAGSEAFTPIPGITTFRPAPLSAFLNPIVLAVPGVAAGTTGVRVQMRVWAFAGTWETATVRGESSIITLGPLGGIPENGPPLVPPNLDGLPAIVIFPEPSTLTLALLGAAVLLFRRR